MKHAKEISIGQIHHNMLAASLPALAAILADGVAQGAAIGFMAPLSLESLNEKDS